MSDEEFQPGDILVHHGETYQVIENLGVRGKVIPFPSEAVDPLDVDPLDMEWEIEGIRCRRIGHAPLPAPTPCSTGDGCPTEGNPVPVNFIPRQK